MLTFGGCYLGHLAHGQVRLLCARTPIERVLADPATPPSLAAALREVDAVRAYASALGLDVGDRYTSYVTWPEEFLVTSVVATQPGEVEPRTSWFPIVGDVPYRGYFDAGLARAEAQRLRAEGFDVCEVPVRAYSTLGWFDDPLTGPMLRQPEPRWVETLFHELLHATVFVAGEADFNEGVAAFFGQEARVRYYARRDGADAGARERAAVARERALRGRVQRLRSEVAELYAGAPPGPERDARRAALEAAARRDLDVLRGTLDAGEPPTWRLNDACLALAGTYHADTSALEAVLAALGGDLAAFVARVSAVAETDAPRERLLGLR